jgi:hypothetical protein
VSRIFAASRFFVELLLNLAWLLLALPAFWLWSISRSDRASRNFSAAQCLLVLGCVLVMLFPVVSATDDLCAMRAEIEESPAGKRGIRQAGNDKPSAWHSRLQIFPAQVSPSTSLALNVEWAELRSGSPRPLAEKPLTLRPGRAPPLLSLPSRSVV